MTFNDMAITAKIKASFASDELLNPLDINIDTHNGVVTLKASVPDQNVKTRAEQLAHNAVGVKDIQNEINVKK